MFHQSTSLINQDDLIYSREVYRATQKQERPSDAHLWLAKLYGSLLNPTTSGSLLLLYTIIQDGYSAVSW